MTDASGLGTPAADERDGLRDVVEIPDQPVFARDGCRLSVRLWRPLDADVSPVPAIVEHLPYRKRDGTVARDALTHPWFAARGYACLRVDMRGNGDSDGLMDDEYTARELDDACDVIAWAAAQPWCTGAVGMMGISWGGFNALQVASLAPPALRAIVTLCSSADRFADDIHFKGGCLLGENAGWAATMLSFSSRPPDPAVVGERWRAMWLERLEHLPFLAARWFAHQRRDAYWRHGSVCEEPAAIEAATLAIGGWHDGYRNTVSALVAGLSAPVKGIVGPWNHKYPHIAAPEPRIGFLQEALRWWERWLRGRDTGVERDPAYRAYLMDSVAPARRLDARPGRWIAERTWPSPSIRAWHLALAPDGALVETVAAPVARPPPDTPAASNVTTTLADAFDLSDPPAAPLAAIRTPADCGSEAGEYFPFTFGPELPAEQTPDDARSARFDGAPLERVQDIVGAPELRVRARVDRPLAQLVVRLCDLRPDGTSALITLGVLNLAHRASREHPTPLSPGEAFDATIRLDEIAYRIPAGHRLRVALSNAYWPYLWPAPEAATVELLEAELAVPLRSAVGLDGDMVTDGGTATDDGAGRRTDGPHTVAKDTADVDTGAETTPSARATAHVGTDAGIDATARTDANAFAATRDEWTFEPPESAAPWPHEPLRATASTRRTERDPASGTTTTVVEMDFGENRDLEHGLESGSRVVERWSIRPDDPLSARVDIRWEQTLGRAGWRIRTVAELRVHADAGHFHLGGRVVATENGTEVFARDYAERVARELV